MHNIYENTKPEYSDFKRENKTKYRFTKGKQNSKTKENSATLMCMGDLMCEAGMSETSRYDDNYFFCNSFKYIKNVLKDADFAIANLETMVDENAPYTVERYKINNKYHCNAPKSYLEALKYAGFDAFAMSNNHNLDCGVDGIYETLKNVDEFDFMRTGLFTPEDKNRYILVDVNNIKIAVLSYSTWFNRNQNNLTEKGREIFINEYSFDKVKKDVETVKSAGAEFVIVYIHWGIYSEYKNEESAQQRMIAQELIKIEDIDYIVGSHTHSLQKFDKLISPSGKIVPVAYSIGNFMTSDYQSITRDNIVLILDLEKINNKINCETRILPCHIYNEFRGINYPIVPTVSQYNNGHGDAWTSLKQAHNKTVDVIGRKCKGYGFDIRNINVHTVTTLLNVDNTLSNNYDFEGIRFAKDAVKNCLAVVSNITSNPNSITSEEREDELADIAIKKGSLVLLSKRQIKDYPCIVVENPVKAFIKIAQYIREGFNPKTVGITGSIGKTSTTEMIYAMLNSKFNTHRNTGSANNVRYAGTVINSLKKQHEVYVQEIMEGPPYGAASTISSMVKPDIGVVTIVGSSHMEEFGSQDRILESCLGIQDGMPERGVLILNGDDKYQVNVTVKKRKVTYGIHNKNVDVRGLNIKSNIYGTNFEIEYKGRIIPVKLNCFGEHNVLNACAAFAVGKEYKMTDEEIVSGLLNYKTSGIRQHLVNYGGYNIYLDCYNSAYESIVTAVTTIENIYYSVGKKIAVIGDVLEGGEKEKEEHEKIGRYISECKLDKVIFYGKRCKWSYDICVDKRKTVFYANTESELKEIIKNETNKQDLILFKASHGIALEKIVDEIFGTWFHEEFERYDFIAKRLSNKEYSYIEYSDHVTLTKYLGKEKSVEIPNTINDKPVTGIGVSCFSRNNTIENVLVGDNVRNIRYCAFYNCPNLSKVILGKNVRLLDKSSFSTCKKLNEVVVNEGITDLCYRSFGNCVSLEKINLPESITKVENEVFLNCDKLKR